MRKEVCVKKEIKLGIEQFFAESYRVSGSVHTAMYVCVHSFSKIFVFCHWSKQTSHFSSLTCFHIATMKIENVVYSLLNRRT